jgi:hypothetical protein
MTEKNQQGQRSEQIDQINQNIANAQKQLDDLVYKQFEVKAELNKLENATELRDAKHVNHALYGAVMAIHTEAEEYLKTIESFCYIDDDTIKCYYELSNRTQNAFLEIASFLKDIATQFEKIAGL